MPEIINWAALLPQYQPPPSGAEQTNALIAMAKLKEAQQQQQGYNALSKLYGNPANVQNGMLSPQALTGFMGTGGPAAQIGLGVMADQAKIQQDRIRLQDEQMQTQLRQQAVNHAEAVSVVDDVSIPAKAEYVKVLKDTGSPQQAQAAADKVYTPRLQMKMQTVSPELQRAMALNPHYDDARVTATIVGAAGIREQIKRGQDFTVQTDTGRSPPVQYLLYKDSHATDITGQIPYTPSGYATTKGAQELYTGTDAQGKPVTATRDAHGWVDANTGRRVPYLNNPVKVGTTPQLMTGTGTTPGSPDLHGDAYLKTLAPGLQPQVKALAEGRMSFPSGFALRSPYWQQMLQAVSQYDPSFDAVNYNARASTRRDFTSGPAARNVTSFNTAIGHLGTLDKAAEGLANTWSPTWNTLANAIESAKGDPRIVRFNTAKQAVADELTRAFRGTGGNVSDIMEWERNLSSSNSPAQLREAIQQAVELLRSRIEAVGAQYRRGMGTTADVMDLLTPAAKRTLERLPGGEDLSADQRTRVAPGGPTGTAPPPNAAPQAAPIGPSGKPLSPSDFPPPRIVDGKTMQRPYRDPATGKIWILRDGKVVLAPGQ